MHLLRPNDSFRTRLAQSDIIALSIIRKRDAFGSWSGSSIWSLPLLGLRLNDLGASLNDLEWRQNATDYLMSRKHTRSTGMEAVMMVVATSALP